MTLLPNFEMLCGLHGFVAAPEQLGVTADNCLVFEDTDSGVQAADGIFEQRWEQYIFSKH